MDSPARWRGVLLRAAPSLLLFGTFCLGFIGAPENSAWLNRSYLWGPGDPFFSETEQRFVASPLLIWRGRPDYAGHAAYPFAGVRNPFRHNAVGLRDDELAATDGRVERVVDLGDSATWGLNLRDRSETYSDQLQAKLDGVAPGRFDVVNAGTIGYSSFQGLQWLRTELPRLEADVVTVYLGNNDAAATRLRDAERVPQRLLALRDWLGHNAFYLLLRKAWLSLRASEAASAWSEFERLVREHGRSPAYQSKQAYYAELARVSPDAYEANLRGIVATVREAGARVILLKVPMNLVWPAAVHPTLERFAMRPGQYWSPTHIQQGYLGRVQRGRPASAHSLAGHPYLAVVDAKSLEARWREIGEGDFEARARAAIDTADTTRFRVEHNLAVWEIGHGRVDAAVGRLERLAAALEQCSRCPVPSDVSQIHYTLGIARLLAGAAEPAFAELERARAVWPFATSPDYHERFERVARDTHASWVDLPERFAAVDPAFRGSALMHDWVHPNAQGNEVIAEALLRQLVPVP